jgi:hypothetical protein
MLNWICKQNKGESRKGENVNNGNCGGVGGFAVDGSRQSVKNKARQQAPPKNGNNISYNERKK